MSYRAQHLLLAELHLKCTGRLEWSKQMNNPQQELKTAACIGGACGITFSCVFMLSDSNSESLIFLTGRQPPLLADIFIFFLLVSLFYTMTSL